MPIKLEEFFNNCVKESPAPENLIDKYIKKLPGNYMDFLKFSNGIEGTVQNGSYIQLWKAEELEESNKGYSIEEFMPGMFLVGSDGDGEALGIDLRGNSKTFGAFYRVPFVPLSWDQAILLGREITDIRTA